MTSVPANSLINPDSSPQAYPNATWQEFLEAVPPNSLRFLQGLKRNELVSYWSVRCPDVSLYCETCLGMRGFESNDVLNYDPKPPFGQFLYYVCKDCERTSYTFSVLVSPAIVDREVVGCKYGQLPPYSIRIPNRVQKLLAPQREMLLKGAKAESAGLGIGAFTYYRRAIEDSRDILFERIIAVAKRLGTPAETITQLEMAKEDFRFQDSVKEFKEVLPQSLLIKGHNPMTILHDALSKGLHRDTDDGCLFFARTIRLVLVEFAERVANALKENSELDEAIKQVLDYPLKVSRQTANPP